MPGNFLPFEMQTIAAELVAGQGLPPTAENMSRALQILAQNPEVGYTTDTGQRIYEQRIGKPAGVAPRDNDTRIPFELTQQQVPPIGVVPQSQAPTPPQQQQPTPATISTIPEQPPPPEAVPLGNPFDNGAIDLNQAVQGGSAAQDQNVIVPDPNKAPQPQPPTDNTTSPLNNPVTGEPSDNAIKQEDIQNAANPEGDDSSIVPAVLGGAAATAVLSGLYKFIKQKGVGPSTISINTGDGKAAKVRTNDGGRTYIVNIDGVDTEAVPIVYPDKDGNFASKDFNAVYLDGKVYDLQGNRLQVPRWLRDHLRQSITSLRNEGALPTGGVFDKIFTVIDRGGNFRKANVGNAIKVVGNAMRRAL